MNDYQLLPPVDVVAPAHALGWSPSRGFITHVDELLEARGEGELLMDVTDAEHGAPFGIVADVEGECPLAVAVRMDRQLLEMRRAQRALVQAVQDIGDRQSGIDTDIAVRLTALAARVRRLEGDRPG